MWRIIDGCQVEIAENVAVVYQDWQTRAEEPCRLSHSAPRLKELVGLVGNPEREMRVRLLIKTYEITYLSCMMMHIDYKMCHSCINEPLNDNL